jgi:hypothetical protein
MSWCFFLAYHRHALMGGDMHWREATCIDGSRRALAGGNMHWRAWLHGWPRSPKMGLSDGHEKPGLCPALLGLLYTLAFCHRNTNLYSCIACAICGALSPWFCFDLTLLKASTWSCFSGYKPWLFCWKEIWVAVQSPCKNVASFFFLDGIILPEGFINRV